MLCTGCQRENPDDARFCNGCGQSLGARPSPARDPRDYTPRHLAERILVSRPALEGERKQVSVLFADIKGSMALAEQVDPEAWHGILDRYFQILAAGVHRHEGTVNQYTGDGVMALFGAPIAHEDHAQRACAAALELQGALRELSDELRRTQGIELETRMGINSGEVVVGRIGDDLRMDYTAQGHTVGLAQRVEQLARAGRTYLAEDTARLVEGYFRLRDLGSRDLAGVSRTVRVYELVGVGPLRTRLDRSRELGFSRLVGRAAELARLEQALASAASGEGRVVVLVAEPGTGKSRLAQELVERARRQGASVREAHALAQDRDAPLQTLGRLVRASLGLEPADPPDVVRATVRARLSELSPADPESVPLVCELLGAPDPLAAAPELDPDARRRRLEEPLVRILVAAPTAAAAPTLLRVEDVHWLDPASRALLARVADRVASTRTPGTPAPLLLVTTRPGLAESWLDAPHERLSLSLLGPEDAWQLARDWLGDDDSVAPLGRRVAEVTGGNPLFVEEILRSLLESGALEGRRGACRLRLPLLRVTLPDTVQSVLAARIDRLPQREKQTLQLAAVVGRRFETAVLRQATGLDEASLAAALGALEQSEFLAPAGDAPEEREFRHPLTQEVAYQTQLTARRRDAHAAVAAALLDHHGASAPLRAASLAHHYERAGLAFEAARWYEHSGRRVARRDTETGMAHCRRACELLEQVPESPEALTLGLTSRIAMLEIGRLAGIDASEADRAFASAEALAERLGDARGRAFLWTAYGRLQGLSGRVERQRELALEAQRVALGHGDPELVFEMHGALLHALLGVGELHEADALAGRMLAELDTNAALRRSASTAPELARLRAGWVRGYLGRFAEADALLRPPANEEESQRFDALYGAEGLRCELARLRGEPLAALEHGRRAVRIAEGVGGSFARVEASAFYGAARLAVGDADGAGRTLDRALSLARDRRAALWYETRLLAGAAAAALAAGRLEQAAALAGEAVSIARDGRGWRLGACDAFLAHARVAQARQEPGAARASLEAARREIARTGAATYAAELADLAQALGEAGPA